VLEDFETAVGVETNGHQNYKNWERMEKYHPYSNADWRKTKNGVFELGTDFYLKSGEVLEESTHYTKMFEKFR
jgi:hypothetical protein